MFLAMSMISAFSKSFVVVFLTLSPLYGLLLVFQKYWARIEAPSLGTSVVSLQGRYMISLNSDYFGQTVLAMACLSSGARLSLMGS